MKIIVKNQRAYVKMDYAEFEKIISSGEVQPLDGNARGFDNGRWFRLDEKDQFYFSYGEHHYGWIPVPMERFERLKTVAENIGILVVSDGEIPVHNPAWRIDLSTREFL